MSGKRKKTDEEKANEDERAYSNVVCKWTHVCDNVILSDEIKRTCFMLKQVQLEAWHVANLHVLRCIENDIALPKLDVTFFNRCCTGVLEGEDGSSPRTCNDSDLDTTLRAYRSHRSSTLGSQPPRLDYASASLLELGAQMRVNTQNMIALHFEKRLLRYVRLYFNKSSKEAKIIVQSCYRKKGAFTPEETELRAWLGCVPSEKVIKTKLAYFVRKLYDMLVWMEIYQREEPNLKDCRVFSLLPYSNFYSVAHIKINGSTLHGMCSRIFQRFKSDEDRRNPLGVPTTARAVAHKRYFQRNRDELLRRAFQVSQFETVGRKFAHQITTNGYSVSILLSRPKTALELEIEQLKRDKVEFDESDLILPENYNPAKVMF